MTASSLRHDHDITMRKSAESLKLFWYEKVAGRWIEKKLLMLYYLWKKQSLPSSHMQSKKFSMPFFSTSSTASSKFSFYVSL